MPSRIKGRIITPKQFGNYLRENYFTLWLAINHHRTHTNSRLLLKEHAYLKEILMDDCQHGVIKKSTQGGVSEVLIVKAYTHAYQGKVVFYVLPTHQLMERFVANRFEKSLMFSKFYREQRTSGRSTDFKKDLIDTRSLKDIGTGVVNFAGSKSDVPFIEIPADVFIVDEADQCDPKRLEMGKERLGHSSDPKEFYVGNPSFVGSFLHTKYAESTRARWHVKAPCGHLVQIDFFKHVVEQIDEHDYVVRDKNFEFGAGGKDLQPICDICGKPFDRFDYGTYVAEKQSHISGKHISRLFSGTGSLEEIVLGFGKALENDYKMQRFYNSVLGESYTAEGSKISRRLLEESTGDFLMPSSSLGPCIMGADVGSVIHVRVNKVLPDGREQAVYIGTVQELSEVFSICKAYKVVAGVIDGLPETRLSRKFSHFKDGYFRCFFGGDKMDSINLKEKTITVSRVTAIDEMKENIVLKKTLFPKNIINLDEYMEQIQEPTRVWNEEKKVYQWLSNRADHFFFAETYLHLARKILKFMK